MKDKLVFWINRFIKYELNTVQKIAIFASILTLLIALALSGINNRSVELSDPIERRKPSVSKLQVFQRAAVNAADATKCSEVGKQILMDNGSVVDSAIATMFCNGLLNQHSMGLGGGFFMTVYIKEEQKAYTIVARETAPAAATYDMFNGTYEKSHKSPLSAAVPGELRGMWAAYKRWGKLPWKSLVTPAINICKEGFKISKAMHGSLYTAKLLRLKKDVLLNKTYVNPITGTFYEEGTLVKPSEALCKTFSRIADKGGDELYNGSLSVEFLEDLHRAGSIITAEDLKNYRVKFTEPIVVPIGNGDTLYTTPPPSSGIILGSILNILSGYKFNASSISTTEDEILTYHRILEAFKYSFATRTKLGDPDFLDLDDLIRNVTSPKYGNIIRLQINDTMTSNDWATYEAEMYSQPDSGTAQLSFIAPNGDAVAVTSSINFYFGAGFSTLNTGIVMNNVMDDFSSPGIRNSYGVSPSPANFIAPGKRPLSSMTPSIIVDKNGNVKSVIGASGGTRITSSVALVAMRMLWFGQTLKEAVDEPRIHHQLLPMNVDYEFGMKEGIVRGLREKGHVMIRYQLRGSTVCALYRNETAIFANADFRKGGVVAGMD